MRAIPGIPEAAMVCDVTHHHAERPRVILPGSEPFACQIAGHRLDGIAGIAPVSRSGKRRPQRSDQPVVLLW